MREKLSERESKWGKIKENLNERKTRENLERNPTWENWEKMGSADEFREKTNFETLRESKAIRKWRNVLKLKCISKLFQIFLKIFTCVIESGKLP